MKENFNEFIIRRHKEKLENASIKHPVMHTVRKYCDDQIVNSFKNEKPSSVFNEMNIENVKPSTFDKLSYTYNKFADRYSFDFKSVKEKLKELSKFFTRRKENFMKRVDEKYEALTSKKSVERKKIKHSAGKKKNPNFFGLFYNSTSAEARRILEGAEIKEEPEIKPSSKLLEKEKINKLLEKEIMKNKFLNFWRAVFFVKPNYVIDISDKIKTERSQKNYETIIYKTYKILSSKSIFKKPTFKQMCRFSLLALIIAFLKFRYNLYSNHLKDISHEIDMHDQIIFQADRDLVKTTPHIFDNDTDVLYEKILKNEKNLLKNYEILENDPEMLSDFEQLINIIYFREAVSTLMTRFILFTYFLYNLFYKKLIKKHPLKIRTIGFRLICLWFIFREFNFYSYIFNFIDYREFPSSAMLKNDQNQIIKYQFYRENMLYQYELR